MVPRPAVQYTTRNLSVIIRVFLSKKLVTENFMALKKTATKAALQDTNLYKCLLGENNSKQEKWLLWKIWMSFFIIKFLFHLEMHMKVRGDQMDEKMFKDYLKNMFNAAGDWDGGRLDRGRNIAR